MPVTNPFDLSVIGEVETADDAGVELALANARRAFDDRDGWLKPATRVDILDRVGRRMAAEREELAEEATREGGKPLKDSLVEVDRAIDGVRNCAELIRGNGGREVPMGVNEASLGRVAFTRKEPIGPVLAFSAFNHPLNLIVHQIGPAIAAGCPVIVKPADATPFSCFRIVEMFLDAGLPEAWCQALVTRDLDLAGRMVADPRVAFFTFIGSGRVGWALRSKLAPGTRCALEHGGAAPVVIAADADLDEAATLLARGGMYHAGQVCVSVQRVFADRRIVDPLTDRLAAACGKLELGDPLLPDTDVGPLIRPQEVHRVHDWIEEARAAGGRVVTGGQPLEPSFYHPTILRDAPREARVNSQEIFGPVVSINPCDDVDEAIRESNRLPFAFQAAVFTQSLDTALDVGQRLCAATVMVNDHTAFRVDWMPFAGLRESGYGVGGIPHTFEDMQTEKLWVIRSKAL